METFFNALSFLGLCAVGGIVVFFVLGAFILMGAAATDEARDAGRD